MLVKCPECELQVSSNAATCPHCGYPLKPTRNSRPRATSNKRRRLPNGFGQISEIKGRNLRKPFRAMVPIGKTESGRFLCKPLKPESYFATYNDAYLALTEYNKNPYDLSDDMTVKELYEKWSEEYFKTLNSTSGIRTVTSAWTYFSDIYHMRARDVRARHIKGCMDEGTCVIKGEVHHPTAGTKARMKSLANLMFDYALEYEIVDKNYARTFNVSSDIIKEKEDAKRGHIPFTEEELQKLWDNVDTMPYVNVVLIQCYSGWRPQELGLIELKNVDLENWTFTGGMKTEAGINRLVPIHTRIRPFVKKLYDEAVGIGSEYLINCTDGTTHRSSIKFTYDKYRHRFDTICAALQINPEHRPHDGRKQFITMAKNAGVDEYAIKYMVGHAITDITEKVYTERNMQWLQTEIEKIR
ncbi:MAG: tyrosine-type recombinase/integrase [Clostridiales bacterium]|nr:tyrosine-type recombinase/integrase [Clostridiales bacterium]